MTGPSLQTVFGRKAGSVASFNRYSEALKKSGLTWDADTLDRYLENPRKVVPGTTMTALVAKADDRRNVIAFLQALQSDNKSKLDGVPVPRPNILDLKTVGDASRVAGIELCGDTYNVTLENGSTLVYWERNLRFKTDSTDVGPREQQPVLLPGGMHGDRASVIFKTPKEISTFIKPTCR